MNPYRTAAEPGWLIFDGVLVPRDYYEWLVKLCEEKMEIVHEGITYQLEDQYGTDGRARVWPDGTPVRRAFGADGKTHWPATLLANPWPAANERGTPAIEKLAKHIATFRCTSCEVLPGELHEPGCEIAECPLCGFTTSLCKCIRDEDWFSEIESLGGFLPWTGMLPGQKEAIEFGLWCKWTITQLSHAWAPCIESDQGAKPDLGTLVKVCAWDKKQRRWVKKSQSELTQPSEVT